MLGPFKALLELYVLIVASTSYRSLLDTAETIIDMETQMEEVESKLGRIAQNCNSRVLDKISGNALKMDTYTRASG